MTGGVRRIPAALVTGGEGRGAREHEKVEANLWVGLDGARDGQRRLVGGKQGTAAEVCSTAVMFRQGSTMRGGVKLREVMVKLSRGLRGSEEV